MPDLHHIDPAAASAAAGSAALGASLFAEDPDFALGCECADPALQIERWQQECGASSELS